MRGKPTVLPTEDVLFNCISRILEKQSGKDAVETIRELAKDPRIWGARKLPWEAIVRAFPQLAGYVILRNRRQLQATA